MDLTQNSPLIKVYASKTARQSGKPNRVVPVLFPILEDILVRAIAQSNPSDRYVVTSNVPRARSDTHRTLKKILQRGGLIDDSGRTLWHPGFQALRACCKKDFLGLGLS